MISRLVVDRSQFLVCLFASGIALDSSLGTVRPLPFSPFFLPPPSSCCLRGQQLRPAGPQGFLPRPLSLSLRSGAIRQNIGQCCCPGIGSSTHLCLFLSVFLSVCQSACLSVILRISIIQTACCVKQLKKNSHSALTDRCC